LLEFQPNLLSILQIEPKACVVMLIVSVLLLACCLQGFIRYRWLLSTALGGCQRDFKEYMVE